LNTTLDVKGMHCGACAARLAAALGAVPGETAARVTLSPPRAEIESAAPPNPGALAAAAHAAGGYTLGPADPAAGEGHAAHEGPATPKPSLYPLLLIVAFISGTVALAALSRGPWSWHAVMNDFMAGFFLVFSFFKLLDLRGFADAYQSYDLIARRWRPWALAYPFIELALGAAYLTRWEPAITNTATLAIMLVGAAGVLRALLGGRAIRCACLGTALNLPMTTVTLVEDLGMAAMAAAMLARGA
jgi:copper chaperone CopZ